MMVRLDELRLAASECRGSGVEVDRNLAGAIRGALRIAPEVLIGYRILNKSVDSRRGHPELVYALALELAESAPATGLAPWPAAAAASLELPAAVSLRHPLVVGAGPAGLFAALALALAGARPVVLERGREVERRAKDIARFHKSRELDSESNYLYGEGGAGTFSDGKLYTRIRDPLADWVIAELLAGGAPEEIAYLKRPHLGSDRLPGIIRNLRRKIVELGGEFRFDCRVAAPSVSGGRCTGVRLASGETVEAPAVILAHGLGGRELTLEAIAAGAPWAPKPFQLGCRIEHPQELIDRRQYRAARRPECLDAAEYHLSSRGDAVWPGVSTFCMCPGGEVVMAAGSPGRLATNGMSRYARAGDFANAALIVTLDGDFFGAPAECYHQLDRLEQKAFRLGGGDYTFPAQDAEGFLANRVALRRHQGSTAFGLAAADLRQLLPRPVIRGLERALPHFDKLLPGFVRQGVLIGLESFISSPVRFTREGEGVAGLYFAGEGAGYAGGIISAAVDGVRTAQGLLNRGR